MLPGLLSFVSCIYNHGIPRIYSRLYLISCSAAGGVPSSFGSRRKVQGRPELLYFLAVLPESGQLELTLGMGGNGENQVDSSAAPSSVGVPFVDRLTRTVYVAEKGGTVTVLNAEEPSGSVANEVLPVSFFASLALTIISRLRGSLGLPPGPEDTRCAGPNSSEIRCRLLPLLGGSGFREWEVDAVGRAVLKRWGLF